MTTDTHVQTEESIISHVDHYHKAISSDNRSEWHLEPIKPQGLEGKVRDPNAKTDRSFDQPGQDDYGLSKAESESDTYEQTASDVEKEKLSTCLTIFLEFLTTNNIRTTRKKIAPYIKSRQSIDNLFYQTSIHDPHIRGILTDILVELNIPEDKQAQLLKEPISIHALFKQLHKALYRSSKDGQTEILLSLMNKPFPWKWVATGFLSFGGITAFIAYIVSMDTLLHFAELAKSWVITHIMTTLGLSIIGALSTTAMAVNEMYNIRKNHKLSNNSQNKNIFLSVFQLGIQLTPYIMKMTGVIASTSILLSSLSIVSSAINLWKSYNLHKDSINKLTDLVIDLSILKSRNLSEAELIKISASITRNIQRAVIGSPKNQAIAKLHFQVTIASIVISTFVLSTGLGAAGYVLTGLLLIVKTYALKRINENANAELEQRLTGISERYKEKETQVQPQHEEKAVLTSTDQARQLAILPAAKSEEVTVWKAPQGENKVACSLEAPTGNELFNQLEAFALHQIPKNLQLAIINNMEGKEQDSRPGRRIANNRRGSLIHPSLTLSPSVVDTLPETTQDRLKQLAHNATKKESVYHTNDSTKLSATEKAVIGGEKFKYLQDVPSNRNNLSESKQTPNETARTLVMAHDVPGESPHQGMKRERLSQLSVDTTRLFKPSQADLTLLKMEKATALSKISANEGTRSRSAVRRRWSMLDNSPHIHALQEEQHSPTLSTSTPEPHPSLKKD